jgi:hypothetical protein
LKIALDAMGGDFAPRNPIAGAKLALAENPAIARLYLVGDTPRIEAELKAQQCDDRRIEIIHTTQIVDMSDSAIDSVRRKKDSSISRSVDLVKKGEADAVVSAGHTGAAVAASTIKLRTLPGIDRPGDCERNAHRDEQVRAHRFRGKHESRTAPPDAQCDHGARLFEAHPRLRGSHHWPHVDRHRGREREHADQGSLRDAQGEPP